MKLKNHKFFWQHATTARPDASTNSAVNDALALSSSKGRSSAFEGSRARRGFTLLETLLALALSSFIMFALMQAYQALVKFIGNAREISQMNQQLAQLAHLVDRDLSSACMPQLHPVIESNKAKGLSNDQTEEQQKAAEQEKPLSDDDKKKKEEKRREERKKCFFAEIDDADFHKFKDKKVELLKACSFITTNALEFYGESAQRWVRVRYELIKDKKSKVDQYTLIRKQSNDINNVKMKISTVDPTANLNNPITVHEVMHGIRGLFIEFSMLKVPEKKGDSSHDKKSEPELIKAFAWGETKKTAGEFPARAHVYIDLWNEDRTRSDKVEIEICMFTFGDVEKILTAAKEQRAAISTANAGDKKGDAAGLNNLTKDLMSGFGDFLKQAGQQGQPGGTQPPANATAGPPGNKPPATNPLEDLMKSLIGGG